MELIIGAASGLAVGLLACLYSRITYLSGFNAARGKR